MRQKSPTPLPTPPPPPLPRPAFLDIESACTKLVRCLWEGCDGCERACWSVEGLEDVDVVVEEEREVEAEEKREDVDDEGAVDLVDIVELVLERVGWLVGRLAGFGEKGCRIVGGGEWRIVDRVESTCCRG